MKKTVLLTAWMYLLVIGILSWLVFQSPQKPIVYDWPPAQIDSTALYPENVRLAEKIKPDSSGKKLACLLQPF